MPALYLFDIDGTLLVTRGLGIRAMELAGQELFGNQFTTSGMEFAGCLDPLLLQEMLIRNRVAGSPQLLADLRARYHRRLDAMLAAAPPGSTAALPGVLELITTLAADSRIILGLLTGNFAETGRLKLRHCGIDPDAFHLHVWGDDSPHAEPSRDHLPAVAHQRVQASRGRVHPHQTVIIGDTPHDIRCAAANNCRAAGVATGKYSSAELHAAGADHVFTDLADTRAVVRTLAELTGLAADPPSVARRSARA